jgi:hypothetical protein
MANQPTVAELQAPIPQLQMQVLALQNAATAAPIVQAAPTAPQAVIFADTPQMLGTKDLIYYMSNKREQKKDEAWKKEPPKAEESKEGKKVRKLTFNWCEHHMASTEVGFFAQMKGKLTKRCYRCATIFVDHCSRLRFVHLQVDDSSAETLAAKRAFETFAAEHGVRIQHYHCDNGRFHNNAFKQACHDA